MNREEFLSACGECEVGYRAQLLDFYRNYADIVDKIYDKYALLDGEDQNKMLVERLMKIQNKKFWDLFIYMSIF